jgi:nucleoside-diphosphate-sugar epimerase
VSQTALITGGSGYFGCLLRDRLLEGSWQVKIFDLVDADDRPPAVALERGDIRDAAAVRSACQGADVVFHNVAQVPLAKDRDLFWAVNCDGTENLLAAVREAGVGKLVHTSSSAVFGVPPRNPVDESVEPRPGEAYGAAKLAAEKLVRRAVEEGGVDASIIRPRTILGHGRLGIFQILFDWVQRGWNVPVLGKGDNVYQFVHADDLADACIRAASRPGFGLYHAGAAEFGTMRESLEALCRHAGTGSRVRSVPMAPAVWAMKATSALGLSPLGPYHALMYGRSLYFDISRTTRELDWKPVWSNADMICQSYDWYVAHRDEIGRRQGGSPHRSSVEQGILSLVGRLL